MSIEDDVWNTKKSMRQIFEVTFQKINIFIVMFLQYLFYS